MTARHLFAVALAGLLWLARATAAPQLQVPDGQLGAAGARVPVNLLLNFSITADDAGAAYRDPYQAARAYDGYFNARLCYQYPMKATAGGPPAPDLDERSGYFSPSGPADLRHECSGGFSGNFLNWAASSTLDLLRYGLTGGDRVIDHAGLTVLQRAWLPDGRFHPDFYAHPDYFPRKALAASSDGSAVAAVTPFAADTLYVVSCRNRILFSDSRSGGSCDAPRLDSAGHLLVSDKRFGEFNARVKVCTDEDSALRPDLCTRYGHGFKPQGHMQQAAQRIGVMSYLTGPQSVAGDQYGGVLRAPLKALGPTAATAPAFDEGPNARAEWHADSGIGVANPDHADGAVSGAINYINLLGRSNPARRGAYARTDPGAELFYEALRYLQGRAPSAAAAAALDDALPVWSTRADPVDLACQRNIIATIGHAAFIDDRFVPGNTQTGQHDAVRGADSFAPGASFDVMRATAHVGELEARSGAAPAGDLRHLDTLAAGPAGAGSYYLAGAAYWAHTHAIRPDKAARVDSYALQLGAAGRPPESALYYAAKYGAFDDRNGDADPAVTTGGRHDNSEWTRDGNRPDHYAAAAGPLDIGGAVRELFAGVGGEAGSGSGPAAAASARDGRFVIETGYDSALWSGSVRRRGLRIAPDGAIDMAAEPAWDAALLLSGGSRAQPPAAPALPPERRSIYTLAYRPGQSAYMVAFSWEALPAAERALFEAPREGAAADGLGQARVDFLRGDRRRESGMPNGVLRRRGGVLGDIMHSAPLIVGPPSAAVQGKDYPAFRARYKDRRGAVYVGANDGMLHAFDVADGTELFAYVPHALLAGLGQLADPNYRHRPYADGSPGQGEANIGGRWRSVLASGMGMGARGVFALDVSDPAAFGGGLGALWEFTERDDPAIGYVRAPPLVAKLKTGMQAGVAVYRYFVIVASGINPASGGADGALFLLALDKPASDHWAIGKNYYKIVARASDTKAANALSQPVLAIAADGSARRAYAGDLQGTLWRFDLSGKPPWGGSLAAPLFVARDASGTRQPIAQAPSLVFAPGGGYLVLFGTGKFIEESDARPSSFVPQSFYAVRDDLAAAPAQVAGRGALAERTLAGSGPYLIKGAPLNFDGPEAVQGWFFDFPHARLDGERAGASALLRDGVLVFDSLLPGPDPCTPASARSYAIDALSGLAIGKDGLAQSGAPTGESSPAAAGAPPLLIEVGTEMGVRNATSGAVATRTVALLRLGRDGKGAALQLQKIAFPAGRLSWREVANWQDLHDASSR